jgi:predicted AAA+ superfamily ATPase
LSDRPLVAYADLADDPLVAAARAAADGDADARVQVERLLFDERCGLAQAMARRVAGSAGPFARAARAGTIDTDRLAVAAGDLAALGALAHADIGLRFGGTAEEAGPSTDLVGALCETSSWGSHAEAVADFHRHHGCGPLALHRVLRFDGAGLHGIPHPDPIALSDLEGREELRRPLLDDLASFAAGGSPNDALLYGPPGTGKSATVRACARANASVRLIQVARDQIEHIDRVFDEVDGDGPRCLVFLDDLVFDDARRADRELRAALEGGVRARPANVLVWATSNRINLTHQTHSERADELDEEEARGEKVALANRFGRRIRFDVRGEDWYLQIALRLLRDRLGEVPEDAADAALRYARTGAGPRPRTAHQFAAQYRA